MKKSKVYTRTGDKGETGLVGGSRALKSDSRIDLYGEVDELNSRIGFATSLLAKDLKFQDTLDFLHHVQSILFDLGSNLACEQENREKYKLPQIRLSSIEEMEKNIDRMDQEIEPIKSFILPGGTEASSAFHLCRTSARTVERKMVHYYHETKEELPDHALVYVNRLSDYFFVLARYINHHQQGKEILWIPGS